MARTRYSLFSSLIAVVLPSAVVALWGSGLIETVHDTGPIPPGLPPIALPDLSTFNVDLLIGALSIAVIVLVQGAGVAESAPNPDGSPSYTNGDFVGQGLAKLAAGLFSGIPVGGSVSSTALNVAAGARSRWAAVFSGLWVLIILVALSGVVGLVAMPTLGAVLIFAGIMSLQFADIGQVWKTSHIGKTAMSMTFVSTLALPVAAAVGIGVFCSLLLQLNKGAMDLKVVRLVPTPGGQMVEQPAPDHLPDSEPVVLDVYGSLLYSGARTLGARLPDPRRSVNPIVVLRLRGRTSLGATFFAVIAGYAETLAAAGGRLYLSGVDPSVVAQFKRSQVQRVQGNITVFDATEVIGASTLAAIEGAQTWLVGRTANQD